VRGYQSMEMSRRRWGTGRTAGQYGRGEIQKKGGVKGTDGGREFHEDGRFFLCVREENQGRAQSEDNVHPV